MLNRVPGDLAAFVAPFEDEASLEELFYFESPFTFDELRDLLLLRAKLLWWIKEDPDAVGEQLVSLRDQSVPVNGLIGLVDRYLRDSQHPDTSLNYFRSAVSCLPSLDLAIPFSAIPRKYLEYDVYVKPLIDRLRLKKGVLLDSSQDRDLYSVANLTLRAQTLDASFNLELLSVDSSGSSDSSDSSASDESIVSPLVAIGSPVAASARDGLSGSAFLHPSALRRRRQAMSAQQRSSGARFVAPVRAAPPVVPPPVLPASPPVARSSILLHEPPRSLPGVASARLRRYGGRVSSACVQPSAAAHAHESNALIPRSESSSASVMQPPGPRGCLSAIFHRFFGSSTLGDVTDPGNILV